MQTKYLEPAAHVTDTQPYALYHNAFSCGEKTIPLHWHPEAELLLLLRGRLNLRVEDQDFQLSAGDGLFIPPQQLHAGAAPQDQGGEFRALVFSTDLIAPPTDAARYRAYVLPVMHGGLHGCLKLQASEIAHAPLLQDLNRIFADAAVHPDNSLLTEGLLRVLWQELYRVHPVLQSSARPSDRQTMLVQETIRFIQQHYTEDISLETLAGQVHVSASRLSRVFHQTTGTTLFAYLNKYRIMKSCELLQSTDKKISEISSMCGFNNISYFNREFLRITRLTPSRYRRDGRA